MAPEFEPQRNRATPAPIAAGRPVVRVLPNKPVGTPLGTIQSIVKDGRLSKVVLSNQLDKAVVYNEVAIKASKEFAKPISKRQVKRCVEAWLLLRKI